MKGIHKLVALLIALSLMLGAVSTDAAQKSKKKKSVPRQKTSASGIKKPVVKKPSTSKVQTPTKKYSVSQLNTPQIADNNGSSILSLQTQIDALKVSNAQLSNKINALENRNNSKSITLSRYDLNVYKMLNSESGNFLICIQDVTNSSSDVNVTLKIGNPSLATYQLRRILVDLRNDDNVLQKSEYRITPSLSPGSWTTVQFLTSSSFRYIDVSIDAEPVSLSQP